MQTESSRWTKQGKSTIERKRTANFTVLGARVCLALSMGCGQALLGQVHAVPVYQIGTVAGNGNFGFSGDGAAATGAEIYYPESVALDSSGNLYIADSSNDRIRMVSAATGLISTVAGGGTGCAAETDSVGDGCPAASAILNGPTGVVLDSAGDIFIADFNNQRVREVIASTGLITTVAGTGYTHAGGVGGYNGDNIAATSAELNGPMGVALDSAGNVYIADSGNNRIRKVTVNSGLITTVAGTGNPGYNADGIAATSAKLNGVSAVALDSANNLYIADTFNSRIRKVTALTGQISTVAGNGTPGDIDGVAATSAEINYPYGVQVDSSGNIFIADSYNFEIREVSASNGVLNTLAGNQTDGYNGDGISSTNAELNYPYGIALDGAGDIFIADLNNDRVRKLSPNAQFPATAIGASVNQTFTFDVNAGTTIGAIKILTQGATGLDFVAQTSDSSSTLCKAQTYSAATTCTVDVTFAPKAPGTRMGAIEIADGSGNLLVTEYLAATGTGPQVAFYPGSLTTIGSGSSAPYGIAVDGSGNVYLADTGNHRVLKETLSGGSFTQSTLGSGLVSPESVAVDGAGNVYIGDSGSTQVIKEAPAAGGGYTQSTLGSGLGQPWGVAVDVLGNAYVSDVANNRLLKETLAGGSYTQSVLVGSGLNHPLGVAVDGNGNVYMVDGNNTRVLKESFTAGIYIQSTLVSGLSSPTGVAVDGTGDVYISDITLDEVLKEQPSGSSYTQSVAVSGGRTIPAGIALDGAGNIYVADEGNNRAVKLDVSDAPALTFATTAVGATSSDSPQTVTVVNNGNAPLSFPIPGTGLNPSISTGFTWNSTGGSSCPEIGSGASTAGSLAAGASCTLPISFSPVTSGTNSGSLVLTDNALNGTNVTQTITLNGVALIPQVIVFTPPPSPVSYGVAPITLVATGGGSGNPVVFSILSGPGTVSGNTLTVTGVGTIVIAANQAGNATYAAAAQVTQSVVVNQASQSINFTAPASPVNYGVAPIALNATATSGLAVSFSVVSGPGTISGSTLTVTGVGTIVVAANQAGNADYAAAAQVTQSVVVNQGSQTITFPNPGTQVIGVPPITLTATASSGLPVSYAVISGPATVSGSTLTITAVGTVTVQATQAGNGDYAAAVPVSVSFAVVLPGDFSIVLNPASFSMSRGTATGSTGTVLVTVTPTNGFNQTVAFSCTGLPSNVSYAFRPATVTPNGAAAATTLTLATNGEMAAIQERRGGLELVLAACCLPLGLLALRRRRNESWQRLCRIVLLTGLLAAGMGLSGCGGDVRTVATWPVTPTGTYTLTVTGNSVAPGGASHVASLTLTITN